MFKNLSDEELMQCYEALSDGKISNEHFQKACHMLGMATAIHQLLHAIAERWYKDKKDAEMPLKVGDAVWYADKDEDGSIEKGEVTSVYYKDGVLDTIGVDFPESKDFTEFYGEALGSCLFKKEEDAQKCVKGK